MNEIKQLSDQTLQDWCEKGAIPDDVVMVDIREPAEYAREHIPGSINMPAATLKDSQFTDYRDKTIVFYCRIGNRTQNVKEKLMTFNLKEAFCLPQGIEQWKNCKMPVIQNADQPIEIMRQVQITAGSAVLIGIIFGYFFSPVFYLLSAFFGAGLLYAGISGSCMLAVMLAKMPWNRIKN